MTDESAFFETLVEKGSDAILSVDEESTVVFANEAVERVLGYTPDELVGEPLTTVMPERFHDRHHAAMERYLRTGERTLDWTRIQLPGEHRDGHEVALSITFEEHRFGDERRFSGIIRDVTAQRTYERRLETLQETAQELLRATDRETICEITVRAATDVLDRAHAAVYLADPGGERLTVVARTTAIPEMDLPTVTPGDTAAWTAFETGEPQRGTPAGDLPIEEYVAVPMGGQGILAVDDPPTDDVGEDLAQLLAATAAAALDRADREAALERQNEQLERFASIVSHDLRDPLNTAMAALAVARTEHESESLAELARIHERMADIIDDVLTLTRGDATVSDPTAVDLGAAVEAAWATVGSERATLTTGDLGTLMADRSRLVQLLENLLGNAVRHGGDGVHVEVTRLADGGFAVADDGPGVPEAERDQVFEYGYTTGPGTGLGLNIVARIAAAHGWTVSVTESAPGGARFEVRPDGDGV